MKPFLALFPESKFDDSFGVSSAAEPLSNGPVGMSCPSWGKDRKQSVPSA
jgi:hypothetical protein